jgi:phosphotransferase system HPr-like phosphotransfer protein
MLITETRRRFQVTPDQGLHLRLASRFAHLASHSQQGISSDRSASSPSERRSAEVEQRLAALEGAVPRLQQETEHVQLDLPIEIGSSRK